MQDILEARHADTGEKGKLQFLLRGTVRCKTCGRLLTAEQHARGVYYRCQTAQSCRERDVPVRRLEEQLELIYGHLQPPKELLEVVKLEVQAIADERERIAKTEIVRAARTITRIESKEVKLVDAMVSERLSRDVYEGLTEQYRNERQNAEARKVQLEVN